MKVIDRYLKYLNEFSDYTKASLKANFWGGPIGSAYFVNQAQKNDKVFQSCITKCKQSQTSRMEKYKCIRMCQKQHQANYKRGDWKNKGK
jgi:hypothetical protein